MKTNEIIALSDARSIVKICSASVVGVFVCVCFLLGFTDEDKHVESDFFPFFLH